MSLTEKFPCPCCGYLVFEEPPGSFDICPICYWEDDVSQLRFPEAGGGANSHSLIQAQKNFMALGATEERFTSYVRSPTPDDRRDPGWRPVDPRTDAFRDLTDGSDDEANDPEDHTILYYWRPSY